MLGRDVCFTWADGYGGWLSSEDPDAGPTPLADVVVLRVKGAKNDVSCGGEIRAQYATGERCCPVKAASDARRRISGGHLPLFPGTSGAIVTAFVRRAATWAGVDPWVFSSHSLRRGGTTCLVAQGLKDYAFELGRWKNPNSIREYVLPGMEKAKGASRAMLSRVTSLRC